MFWRGALVRFRANLKPNFERTPPMTIFEIADLLERRRESGESYREFLNVPSMRLGVYELPAGSDDPQRPHAQDEIYYAIAGRAQIRVGNEDAPVARGSVIFVEAGVPHRFHSITEDLTLLVAFAPGG